LDGENFYNNAPLLRAAEDLCKALDEGLISELVFVSSTRGIDNRKKKVFNNVFAFSYPSNCQIFLNPQKYYIKVGDKRCD